MNELAILTTTPTGLTILLPIIVASILLIIGNWR